MKKNILFAVYDMEIGGIERSLINMLDSFDYEKFNVDLLVFEHKGEFMDLIPEKVNLLPQVNKYTVFRKPIIQCIKERHITPSVIRILSKYIANGKAKHRDLEEGSGYIQMQLASKYTTYFLPKLKKSYDVAISYAWPHDLIANRVNAYKKIAWIHTDYSKLEIDNKIDLKMWEKFDFIVSISEDCTKSFITMYPSLEKKIILIENINSPNFIKNKATDIPPFNEMPSTFFNLLTVGRLSYVKGLDLAVKALRLLHDRGFSNVKWNVIGYGGYEQDLINLIDKYELNNSFLLLGKKTNPYPYMRACDLYVQPSRYEGKAVTVTEAQILGRPVLLTNYPTSSAQVKDGIDGIICDLSVEGIAEGIERIIKNHNLINKLIKNTSENDYSNSKELKKLYEVIGAEKRI